uniref:DNA-directed RNA polymerase n=1 Tax=Heterorhabditis bacteriophora TaxID=37862 RepID=A0A1I7WL46_HETBA
MFKSYDNVLDYMASQKLNGMIIEFYNLIQNYILNFFKPISTDLKWFVLHKKITSYMYIFMSYLHLCSRDIFNLKGHAYSITGMRIVDGPYGQVCLLRLIVQPYIRNNLRKYSVIPRAKSNFYYDIYFGYNLGMECISGNVKQDMGLNATQTYTIMFCLIATIILKIFLCNV